MDDAGSERNSTCLGVAPLSGVLFGFPGAGFGARFGTLPVGVQLGAYGLHRVDVLRHLAGSPVGVWWTERRPNWGLPKVGG